MKTENYHETGQLIYTQLTEIMVVMDLYLQGRKASKAPIHIMNCMCNVFPSRNH